MLKVEHVSKKYGKVLANQDISLTVAAGQRSVLLGPNGAGKSTLIKCIMGLLRFKGDILIDGHPNKSVEAKALLGYVPEIPAVYDLLTVGEHLEFIARAYKLENWEEDGDRLLERLELMSKKNALGKELSKGMQQKLSIACALLPKPQVAVFDEPLVGLDPHAIKELKEILHEISKAGTATILSTHMLDSIEDGWDTAYIMMDGKIAAQIENGQEGQQTLEEQFFAITEGGEAKS